MECFLICQVEMDVAMSFAGNALPTGSYVIIRGRIIAFRAVITATTEKLKKNRAQGGRIRGTIYR
jgi:hypothetical protein